MAALELGSDRDNRWHLSGGDSVVALFLEPKHVINENNIASIDIKSESARIDDWTHIFRREVVAIKADVENADVDRVLFNLPDQRAQALVLRARDYLSRGLLLESERLFREAASTNPRLADAHVGLAEVRERSGDANGAHAEALASIQIKPTAGAYLVLARIDPTAGQYDSASRNANFALQFEPNNAPARDLLRQIDLKRTQPK